jgi:DNA-binding response OmpR family regulator
MTPDLILLDLHMPELDGFAVLEALAKHIRPGTYLRSLVIIADVSPEAKHRALALGAKDFLTKPFDAQEVVLRVGNMLETRRLHLELREQNRTLEVRVRDRPQTNGKVERYHRTLAREWAYSQAWSSNDERRAALGAFLDRYNYHRPHTALGGKPPISRCSRVSNLAA